MQLCGTPTVFSINIFIEKKGTPPLFLKHKLFLKSSFVSEQNWSLDSLLSDARFSRKKIKTLIRKLACKNRSFIFFRSKLFLKSSFVSEQNWSLDSLLSDARFSRKKIKTLIRKLACKNRSFIFF